MKFLITNFEINKETIENLPFDLFSKKIGPFNILVENREKIIETTSHFSITDGYLRDLSKRIDDLMGQEESTIFEIISGWPVPENITGSFSSCIIDKNNFEVILCNDLIGVYPLYYLKNNSGFYIANSIILLGAVSNCEFDETGIVQRCLGPEFSNIGSRTILKDCKRLLPGEYLKFSGNGNELSREYDNSLYQNISSSNQKHQLHKEYWKAFKKEVEYCLSDSEIINIALSGGIDSRLVLGAIPEDKDITCLTFGGEENYETKIASHLAKIKRANFKSFEQLNLYFPPFNILKKYTLTTEAVNLCSWFEILENIKLKSKVPLFLGDMAEALNGRNIKKFSSKSYRQENFIKYYVLNKDYQFDKATSANFKKWKEATRSNFDRWYTEDRLSKLDLSIDRTDLIAGLNLDLDEIFSRIGAHKLPLVELYDELFSWFTHSRIPMAKQILLCNNDFYSFSPPMSTQIIRNTSNLHPNLRLNYRFSKKLFKESKELKKFYKVPTSQIPLIPQYFSDFFKFPAWGIRSKIDGYLIKRMIKSKDVTKRYRLFNSINWAKVYQNPDMEKNLKEYFKNNHLGEGFFQSILNQCIQRKELNQWPFANIDIMNAASLNVEIDLIKTLRKKADEV